MARLTTKLRYGLAELLVKGQQLAFMNPWIKHSFLEPTFERLTVDGYRKNAAVFACISTLAFGYNEPPPRVVDRKGEPLDTHPLQKLLDRPNPLMSHAELMQYIITYKAVGGQCYLHKVRGGNATSGPVIQLWPHHPGHISPIPSPFGWVEEYEYDVGDGKKIRIPAADIIHLKWPSIDLSQPWMAMPPLRAIAQEVDTDNEMILYQYALLKNDATPRTMLNVKTHLNDAQFERLRQQFSQRHGGANRGGVGIVEGDATVTRMSLNLQELAFEALHRVPEARIAAAFRVPPVVAGLFVGIEHMTYSNYAEAIQQMTRGTFVPLWKSDATELTQALAPEFNGDVTVEYNLDKVAALQEDQNEKVGRAVQVFTSNGSVLDEFRESVGLPPIDQVITGDQRGTMFSYELKPAPQPPAPRVIDAIVEPRQLTDDQKRYPFPLAFKARREDSTADVQARMAAAVEDYLKAVYEEAVP